MATVVTGDRFIQSFAGVAQKASLDIAAIIAQRHFSGNLLSIARHIPALSEGNRGAKPHVKRLVQQTFSTRPQCRYLLSTHSRSIGPHGIACSLDLIRESGIAAIDKLNHRTAGEIQGISSKTGCQTRHFYGFNHDRWSSGTKWSGGRFNVQRRYLTHYERLDISPNATQAEIKKAYFMKAKESHPDIHGDSKTQEFQELSAAYAVLSDPKKRAAYDASGYQDRNYDTPTQQGGPYQQSSEMPDLDQAFAMFRDVFAEFGLNEYFKALQQDAADSYEDALAKQSYSPLFGFVKRRKLFFGALILPTLLVFRFPPLAIAATRAVAGLLFAVVQFLLRNPQLQRLVGAWVWKKFVELLAGMQQRKADREYEERHRQKQESKQHSQQDNHQNQQNNQQGRNRGARRSGK